MLTSEASDCESDAPIQIETVSLRTLTHTTAHVARPSSTNVRLAHVTFVTTIVVHEIHNHYLVQALFVYLPKWIQSRF